MMPIIQVGPLAVQLPGLILILGVWFGLNLSEKHTSRFNIDGNLLYNLVITIFISGVVGGRLLYIISYPEAFLANPLSILSINPGLIDPFGGLIIAAIISAIYLQRKEVPILNALDALTPTLAVTGIAFSLSQLASGNGYGLPTDLPWAIELWGSLRHPTQIYEILLGGLILWLLWPGRLYNKPLAKGEYFTIFVILESLTRIFTESFHGDRSISFFLGLPKVQIGAWITLAIGLIFFEYHQIIKQTNEST